MQSKRFMSVAAVLGSVLSLSAVSHAATVTLNTADGFGTSSFDAAGSWSNGAAPSSANDYVVGVQFLRTPAATGNTTYTFGGNSLSLNTGGGLLYKGTGSQVFSFNNLIMNGGLVRSGASSADLFELANKISVTGTGSEIRADQNNFVISAAISGTGPLLLNASNTNGYNLTVTGVSTYTGNLSYNTANAAIPLTFSATSGWTFKPTTSGVTNSISAATGSTAVTPITFNGAFNINLSTASSTLGSAWTLVGPGLTPTYGTTFNIPGFTQTGTVWSNGGYAFDQTTGVLTVVPEPASIAALSLVGLAGLSRRRR